MSTKTTSKALNRAASKINATELSDGEWIYYADETSTWYVVTEDELVSLAVDYMDSDDDAIASDAYSHWCAGTTAGEATAEQIAEVAELIPAQIRTLAHDESFPDRDGLVAAIVALALDGEPIGDDYGSEYAAMGQGDAVAWCELVIEARKRMALREET